MKRKCRCCQGYGVIFTDKKGEKITHENFKKLDSEKRNLKLCALCNATGKVEVTYSCISDLISTILDYVANVATEDIITLDYKGKKVIVDCNSQSAIITSEKIVLNNISEEVTIWLKKSLWQAISAKNRRCTL